MDTDKIAEFVKKYIFGGIQSLFGGLTSTVNGAVDMVKEYGGDTGKSIADGWDSLWKTLSGFFDNLLGTVDKDAATAKTATETALKDDKTYASILAPLGLTQEVSATTITNIKSLVTEANSEFLKEGIPALSKQGTPVKALAAARDLHEKIVDYLTGDNTPFAGSNLSTEDLEKRAQAVATAITGVTSESNNTMALPKTGLVATWGNLQLKVNAKDFQKETLAEADAKITFNPSEVTAVVSTNKPIPPEAGDKAKDVAANNTQIEGGKDVQGTTSPPVVKNNTQKYKGMN